MHGQVVRVGQDGARDHVMRVGVGVDVGPSEDACGAPEGESQEGEAERDDRPASSHCAHGYSMGFETTARSSA